MNTSPPPGEVVRTWTYWGSLASVVCSSYLEQVLVNVILLGYPSLRLIVYTDHRLVRACVNLGCWLLEIEHIIVW